LLGALSPFQRPSESEPIFTGFEGAGQNYESLYQLDVRCQGCEGKASEREAGHQSPVATEASIRVVSFALVFLGVVKAAYSEHPLFWLAIWPTPIVLISTLTVFLRQGFLYHHGVLVLGRRER
jgi:uncharacterized protein (DUF983 family)